MSGGRVLVPGERVCVSSCQVGSAVCHCASLCVSLCLTVCVTVPHCVCHRGASPRVSLCHQDWSLQMEAFEPRHELDADRPSSPDQPLGGAAGTDSPQSTADESDVSVAVQLAAASSVRPEILSAQPFVASLPSLTGLVADALRCHAQQVGHTASLPLPACLPPSLPPSLHPSLPPSIPHSLPLCPP